MDIERLGGIRGRVALLVVACTLTAGWPATTALAQPAPSTSAPLEAPSDLSAIKAQSASLTPEQRDQARSLFATGFKLWQSGDFAAAEIAFGRGLAIDPANPVANYYYGDCLLRRSDAAAGRYFTISDKLGGDGVEAFKARAALDSIKSNLPPDTVEGIKIALIGTWRVKKEQGPDGDYVFGLDGRGELTFSAIPLLQNEDRAYSIQIDGTSIQIDGNNITIHTTVRASGCFLGCGGPYHYIMNISLVTPTHMEVTNQSEEYRNIIIHSSADKKK